MGGNGQAGSVGLSPTGALRQRVKEIRREGGEVIDLGAGELVSPTPEHILAAAREALGRSALHHYGPTAGEKPLREAIAARESKRLGVELSASGVVVANGAKQALFGSLRAILNPGDEVLVLAPYWVTFPAVVRLVGAEPVIVPADPATLLPDLDALNEAVTDRTRAIILNSPNNPTGRSYPDELIRGVVRRALLSDLWLIADETYTAIALEPSASPVSLVPEIADRVVVVNSLSKSHAMSGWRLGWSLGPEGVASTIAAIQSHTTSHANRVVQESALAAISGPDVSAVFRQGLQRTRDMAVDLLTEAGLDFPTPNGGFYLFPRVEGSDDGAFANSLLTEHGVAVVPGSAFGAPGHVRASYTRSEEEVRTGLERLVALTREAELTQA